MSFRAGIGAGAAVTFALLYAAACSSYASNDPVTPAVDGGSEPPDTGTLLDATAAVDADVVAPTFADDFERDPSKLNGSWGASQHGAGSTIALDQTEAHSGTNALHVEVEASTETESGSSLVKNFTLQRQTHARVSFWARLSSERHAAIVELSLTDSTKPSEFEVITLTNEASGIVLGVQVGSGPFMNAPAVAASLGQWHAYELDVDWSDATVRADFAFDSATFSQQFPAFDGATNFQLSCGPEYVEAGPALDAWYDDVTLELGAP